MLKFQPLEILFIMKLRAWACVSVKITCNWQEKRAVMFACKLISQKCLEFVS